jgi:hypothetical protein
VKQIVKWVLAVLLLGSALAAVLFREYLPVWVGLVGVAVLMYALYNPDRDDLG